MDEHEHFREVSSKPDAEILAELFLKFGVVGISKDMAAQALGLTRKELDQRFRGKVGCLMQAAQWFGAAVWQPVNRRYGNFRLTDGQYTGAELLEMYMIDLKKVFLQEPRLFIFYAECKTYYYRYSISYEKNYNRLVETVGCQERIEKIIQLGQQDGSLQPGADAREEADYFYKAYFGFLFNTALTCGDQPKEAVEPIDRYIARVVSVFRKERVLPRI